MTLSISKFAACLFAALLTVASLAPALHAQSVGARSIAKVPFAFEAGDRHFEPGLYAVSLGNNRMLAVASDKDFGTASTWIEMDSAPASKGKLVFRKIGDRYFLTQVWNEGSSEHLQCVPTRAEGRAKKAVLAMNQAPAQGNDAPVVVATR